MKILAGKDVWKRLGGAIHEEKQVGSRSVDLTARAFYRLEERGRLDFGGSEYVEARRTPVETVRRDPGDAHGWWCLAEGTYLMELNESIEVPSGTLALVAAHPRALANGMSFAAVAFSRDDGPSPLIPVTVSERGLDVKENARVALVRLLA